MVCGGGGGGSVCVRGRGGVFVSWKRERGDASSLVNRNGRLLLAKAADPTPSSDQIVSFRDDTHLPDTESIRVQVAKLSR